MEESRFDQALWIPQDPKRYFLQIKTVENLRLAYEFEIGGKAMSDTFYSFHLRQLYKRDAADLSEVKTHIMSLLEKWFQEIDAWTEINKQKQEDLKVFLHIAEELGFNNLENLFKLHRFVGGNDDMLLWLNRAIIFNQNDDRFLPHWISKFSNFISEPHNHSNLGKLADAFNGITRTKNKEAIRTALADLDRNGFLKPKSQELRYFKVFAFTAAYVMDWSRDEFSQIIEVIRNSDARELFIKEFDNCLKTNKENRKTA